MTRTGASVGQAEADREPPKLLLHRWLEWSMVHGGWTPAALGASAGVAGSVLLGTVGDLSEEGQVLRAWLGGILAAVAAGVVLAVDWWRRRTEASGGREVAQYRITLTDAILPMAEAIASMPTQPSAVRQRTAVKAIGHAKSSLLLLFHETPKLRVVVYEFSEGGKQLDAVDFAGRANKPRPFISGDGGRGDAAFARIRDDQEPLFVRDTHDESFSGKQHAGTSYRTFISAAIRADGRAYGMLTIDAPVPGTISEHDAGIVSVLATLLGIALAERDRR